MVFPNFSVTIYGRRFNGNFIYSQNEICAAKTKIMGIDEETFKKQRFPHIRSKEKYYIGKIIKNKSIQLTFFAAHFHSSKSIKFS